MELKNRILDILKTYSNKVLIEDDLVQWTGQDILFLTEQIQNTYLNYLPTRSYVGICFPNQAIFALSIIATYLSDHVPVLINYIDVNESNPKDFFNRKKMSHVILADTLLEELTDHKTSLGSEDQSFSNLKSYLRLDRRGLVHALEVPKEKNSQDRSDFLLHLNNNHDDIFSVLFTSGSTGDSKPIPIPAAGVEVTSDFLNSYFDLKENDIATVVLPICFSMSLNTQFIPALLKGAKSIFINSRLNYMKLYNLVQDSQGTSMALIGDVLRTCWEQKKKKNLPPALTVKHVQLAGGPVLPEYVKMACELFPNAVIYKGYGLTEAIRVSMIDSRDPDFETACVGHPLPFVDLKIDNENGEIFVKGPNVMVGFENQYIPTGDFGYLNEKNQLVVLGRRDGVFKVSGQRIAGATYENIALNFSQVIKSAKCLSVADAKRNSQKIILFLEIEGLYSSFEIFKNDVFADLEIKLKELSFYPKDLVLMNRFPRTSNGKIKLSELQTQWLNSEFDRIEFLFQSALRWHTLPILSKELKLRSQIDQFLKVLSLDPAFNNVTYFKFEFRREWSSNYDNYRRSIREGLIQSNPQNFSLHQDQFLNLDLIPEHPQYQISISHCQELGGYVAIDEHHLLGVDVEVLDRVRENLVRRVQTTAEISEFKDLHPALIWTAKESAFKALSKHYGINVISELCLTQIKNKESNIYQFEVALQKNNQLEPILGQGFILLTESIALSLYVGFEKINLLDIKYQSSKLSKQQLFAEDLIFNLNREYLEQ